MALSLRDSLPPFVLSQALPWAFGYYGSSVAIGLESRRRSRIYATWDVRVCRITVRFLTLFVPWYSPQRAFTSCCVKLARAVSPLQRCCGGRRISPLEARDHPHRR